MARSRAAFPARAEPHHGRSSRKRKPGAPDGPGLFSFAAGLGNRTIREDDMKRKRLEYRKPYGRGDYELHRGAEGVYWRAGHGLVVRLASAEREQDMETRDLSGEACALEVCPSITAH